MKENHLIKDDLYIQFFYNESIPKIMTDPESLRIVDANGAAVKFYGYGDDLLNMKVSQINTLSEDQVKKAAIKAKTGPQVFYFRHRLASGDIRDVEVYTNIVPVQEKIYIQSAIIDITERNRVYKELYNSEQRYRQLFKNMSEAFAYCKSFSRTDKSSMKFEILEVNDAFEELFNVKAEEILNCDFAEAIPRLRELSEDIAPLLCAVNTLSEPAHSVKYFSCIDKWLKINYFSPAHGYFVVMINDVTSQKLFEKSLSESHQFLKSIFNTLHISIAILDENGMIVQLNDSWKRQKAGCYLLGPDCRVGMNYFELCNEAVKGVHGDGALAQAATIIETLIEETMLAKSLDVSREVKIGDGYFRVTPRLFEWPETYRTILAFEDITLRKQSEEKIRKLSMAVEQSPAAVIITDSEGVIEYVNQKFVDLTQYSLEEAVGQTPRFLKSGFHGADYYSNLWRTIKSGMEWRGEFRNKRKNGELYWESASITPIVGDEGLITHFVALKEDIGIKKSIEEELKKSKLEADEARVAAEDASTAKSRFLANMSHEIRTPMNSIIGFTDMLSSTALNEEQQELLEYVKTSSGALLSLINDILDLSKIEAGKLEIDNAEFELNSILDQVIGITRVNAAKKGIRFTYMLDSAINFRVFSDPTRLRQVLLNLVDNAIKFTETTKNVKIIISLESETPETADVKFMVSDEGIGIPESKIGTIFMSFMQSDTSITRKYGGTGLGLTISNHIIKLMGAEGIKVRSAEGAGSDFYFTLRMKKGSAINYSDSGHGGAVFAKAPYRKKFNILLVEDNPSNIALTTKVLIKFGHNVAVAVNGEEAVSMSLKHSYDLILMDIQMPVMDGFEATRAIRSRGDEIPIIAMTASAMKGDHEACMAVGMDGYIPKPINITEINATIETVLARTSLKAGAKKSLPAFPAEQKDEKPRDISHNDAALERAAAKIPGLVSQPADESDLKIFDPEKLMFNMGGIKELAVDSVNMFLEYSAAYLKEVKDALDEKNPERIKRAAHKFKGTSLNACALRVANLLLKIEIISKSGSVEECVSLYSKLVEQIDIYKNEVSVSEFFIDK